MTLMSKIYELDKKGEKRERIHIPKWTERVEIFAVDWGSDGGWGNSERHGVTYTALGKYDGDPVYILINVVWTPRSVDITTELYYAIDDPVLFVKLLEDAQLVEPRSLKEVLEEVVKEVKEEEGDGEENMAG